MSASTIARAALARAAALGLGIAIAAPGSAAKPEGVEYSEWTTEYVDDNNVNPPNPANVSDLEEDLMLMARGTFQQICDFTGQMSHDVAKTNGDVDSYYGVATNATLGVYKKPSTELDSLVWIEQVCLSGGPLPQPSAVGKGVIQDWITTVWDDRDAGDRTIYQENSVHGNVTTTDAYEGGAGQKWAVYGNTVVEVDFPAWGPPTPVLPDSGQFDILNK